MRGVLLVGLLWLSGPTAAEAADPETEGLCAFVAGRFNDAAIGLERALGQQNRRGETGPGANVYFLGRAFRELGLQGLAIRTLAEAEAKGGPESRALAGRELARVYTEAGNWRAVLDILERRAGEPDPEIGYLAGVAVAQQRDWLRAIEILGEVSPSSELFGYARYVRAQSEAAANDFAAALADLEEVIRRARVEPASRPKQRLLARSLLEPLHGEAGMLEVDFLSTRPSSSLRDRAELLRGKILYLEGRGAEARAAFAAVAENGTMMLEAIGGLMLTGDGLESEARVHVSRSRAIESAALLTAEAVAAEAHQDLPVALHARSALRDLVRRRLSKLDRLSTDPSLRAALEEDIADFWLQHRRTRAAERLREEAPLLQTSCSFGPAPSPYDEPIEPRDGIVYGLWDRSSADARLRSLVELRARSDELAAELEAPLPATSSWRLWGAEDHEGLRAALLVIRLASLRLLTADHVYDFTDLTREELAARKRAAVKAAENELDELILGGAMIDEKQKEMLETLDPVPERATDRVIEAFGTYVDLLADGSSVGWKRPVWSGLIERLREGNRALEIEISAHLQRAIEKTRRAQVAFFHRVEADNQGSLSRLYGRLAGEPTLRRGDR